MKQPSQPTQSTQRGTRNGRTYTMLENNERELKQQLYERDQRLKETERRQEV